MKDIPEIKLHMVADTPDARSAMGFKYAAADVGLRSKIGGEPDFRQNPYVPICDSCNQNMTFYSQIDSVGDGIALTDVGLVYVFVCFDCFKAESFIQ